MAPSLNTKTLSLCSLISLLLFLHVHGSSARELKVEEELPEQNEAAHIHYPSSQKDQTETSKPYITSYGNVKKVNEPYFGGYRHSQNSKKEKSEPYITAYGTTSKRENRPYITAYGNDKKVNEPYFDSGYHHSQNGKEEKSKPYITAYGNTSKRENWPYSIYGNNKKVNEAYFGGYRHSQNDKKEKSEQYITAYGGTSKKENRPYITAYGNDKKANEPYFDGGYRHSQNGKEEKSEPYITAYGGTSKRENWPYSVYGNDKKVNEAYFSGYRHSQNGKKVKSEPYITAYGGTSKRENQPYITRYINGKKVNQPDITALWTGKKDSPGENPKESFAAINKVDHTEAFKTGFFALDDLYLGNKMTLQFPIEEFPHFLTRKEADSIPFSTSQLPSVLQLLSVPQDSPMAQAMRGTLEQCELQPLTAEKKVCVSSLESMIDFVRSIIDSDSRLDILTTTLPETSRSVPLQSLTVLEISPDFYAPKWVACHPLPYPYAVFYCHFIGSGTKIFKVKLGSENGEQMEALGVCHLDTSEWDPDHILFKQLGFKAGEAPACHFMPVKHLMWIPLPSEATM